MPDVITGILRTSTTGVKNQYYNGLVLLQHHNLQDQQFPQRHPIQGVDGSPRAKWAKVSDEPVTRGTNPYKWVVCIAINDNIFVISNQLLNFLLNWTLRNVVIKSKYLFQKILNSFFKNNPTLSNLKLQFDRFLQFERKEV